MNPLGPAWSRSIALGVVLAACSPGDKRAAAEGSEPASAALTLTRDRLDTVRDAFNAGSDGPRLIVFFSSGSMWMSDAPSRSAVWMMWLT